ncbi:perlustrin-like [Haliotis rubra]|uniref:perlustrin-like n=1 Tax=Haliotis rubra TaxID=36100 RepID=UPI001EE5D0B6|nr:perlustrin-like [Haliotis rubra]
MSRIFLMVGIILGVVFVDLSNGLSCLRCDKSKCVDPPCEQEHQIRDLCGCCNICGGRVGDSCSGIRRCVNGMWCIAITGEKAEARLNPASHEPFRGVCGILGTSQEILDAASYLPDDVWDEWK